MVMRPRTILLALLATAASMSCSEVPTQPGSKPRVTGTVSRIDVTRGQLLIAPLSEPLTGFPDVDRVIVNMPSRTEIVRQLSNGRRDRVSLATLEQGDEVEVWTTEVALKSYPLQFGATYLVVRPHVPSPK